MPFYRQPFLQPLPGTAAVVTFADTPQTLNANDLLDYSTKRGSSIYEQGCKALDCKTLAGGFGMTTDQTVVFVEAVSRCATTMGWNKDTKQITTFTNRGGTPVDLIKCYGQINKATLKMACERFCKAVEADAESCAKQNNRMMAILLASSLMAEAQARLLTYRNEYTFDGVEYAPLLSRRPCKKTFRTLEFLQRPTRSMARLTGIICSCWPAVPPLTILLGSCLMPTVLSPATTSRSTSTATMMIGLMRSSLE
jgi:hypothetical protein